MRPYYKGITAQNMLDIRNINPQKWIDHTGILIYPPYRIIKIKEVTNKINMNSKIPDLNISYSEYYSKKKEIKHLIKQNPFMVIDDRQNVYPPQFIRIFLWNENITEELKQKIRSLNNMEPHQTVKHQLNIINVLKTHARGIVNKVFKLENKMKEIPIKIFRPIYYEFYNKNTRQTRKLNELKGRDYGSVFNSLDAPNINNGCNAPCVIICENDDRHWAKELQNRYTSYTQYRRFNPRQPPIKYPDIKELRYNNANGWKQCVQNYMVSIIVIKSPYQGRDKGGNDKRNLSRLIGDIPTKTKHYHQFIRDLTIKKGNNTSINQMFDAVLKKAGFGFGRININIDPFSTDYFNPRRCAVLVINMKNMRQCNAVTLGWFGDPLALALNVKHISFLLKRKTKIIPENIMHSKIMQLLSTDQNVFNNIDNILILRNCGSEGELKVIASNEVSGCVKAIQTISPTTRKGVMFGVCNIGVHVADGLNGAGFCVDDMVHYGIMNCKIFLPFQQKIDRNIVKNLQKCINVYFLYDNIILLKRNNRENHKLRKNALALCQILQYMYALVYANVIKIPVNQTPSKLGPLYLTEHYGDIAFSNIDENATKYAQIVSKGGVFNPLSKLVSYPNNNNNNTNNMSSKPMQLF